MVQGHEPGRRVAEREYRLQQRERPHLSRVVAGIGDGGGTTEGMPNNMRPTGRLPSQNLVNPRSLIGHIRQGGGLDRQASVPQRVKRYHPVAAAERGKIIRPHWGSRRPPGNKHHRHAVPRLWGVPFVHPDRPKIRVNISRNTRRGGEASHSLPIVRDIFLPAGDRTELPNSGIGIRVQEPTKRDQNNRHRNEGAFPAAEVSKLHTPSMARQTPENMC